MCPAQASRRALRKKCPFQLLAVCQASSVEDPSLLHASSNQTTFDVPSQRHNKIRPISPGVTDHFLGWHWPATNQPDDQADGKPLHLSTRNTRRVPSPGKQQSQRVAGTSAEALGGRGGRHAAHCMACLHRCCTAWPAHSPWRPRCMACLQRGPPACPAFRGRTACPAYKKAALHGLPTEAALHACSQTFHRSCLPPLHPRVHTPSPVAAQPWQQSAHLLPQQPWHPIPHPVPLPHLCAPPSSTHDCNSHISGIAPPRPVAPPPPAGCARAQSAAWPRAPRDCALWSLPRWRPPPGGQSGWPPLQQTPPSGWTGWPRLGCAHSRRAGQACAFKTFSRRHRHVLCSDVEPLRLHSCMRRTGRPRPSCARCRCVGQACTLKAT